MSARVKDVILSGFFAGPDRASPLADAPPASPVPAAGPGHRTAA
jgi:hypothetical protein